MLREKMKNIPVEMLPTYLFFLIITILFTTPIGEGDFYWHVKTGQWIWQHLALPSVDPFSSITSYVTNTEHTVRRTAFVLKQYWLGQLALFWVWSIGKEGAMVLLRAGMYTSILIMIYQWLYHKVGNLPALATVFFIGNELKTFSNERPQIFAYLFFVLLVMLLEQLSSRDDHPTWKEILQLAGLMLLWSNSHGSYILGVVVIGIYLAAYLVRHIYRHHALTGIGRYPLALLAAMLISGLNPNGFMAFRIVLDLNQQYAANVAEYTSPLTLATKLHLVDYYYWIPLIFTVTLVICLIRKLELRQSVTLLLLAAMSTTATRYIPFFMLATPLLTLNLPRPDLKKSLAIIPLAAILVWGGCQQYRDTFSSNNSYAFPEEAMVFLNHTKPAGMLFNPYEWGGYLMLHTGYKVFVDGRGLVENFTALQQNVLDGVNWQGTLSYFKINTLIIPGTDAIRNLPYRLLWELRNAPEWVLVYQDAVAVVFVRNIPENREIIASYALPKSRIAQHIMERQEWQRRSMQ